MAPTARTAPTAPSSHPSHVRKPKPRPRTHLQLQHYFEEFHLGRSPSRKVPSHDERYQACNRSKKCRRKHRPLSVTPYRAASQHLASTITNISSTTLIQKQRGWQWGRIHLVANHDSTIVWHAFSDATISADFLRLSCAVLLTLPPFLSNVQSYDRLPLHDFGQLYNSPRSPHRTRCCRRYPSCASCRPQPQLRASFLLFTSWTHYLHALLSASKKHVCLSAPTPLNSPP